MVYKIHKYANTRERTLEDFKLDNYPMNGELKQCEQYHVQKHNQTGPSKRTKPIPKTR